MKKLAPYFLFIFLAQSTMAHVYPTANTKQDAESRTWKFEDKSIAAEGSFLKAVEGEIFIQQANSVNSFPIEILSWVDQKHVTEQLRAKEMVQEKSSIHIISWSRLSFNVQALLSIFGLVLISSLVVIWLRSKWSFLTFNKTVEIDA